MTENLCGFSLKTSKPLAKVCKHESHQESKVFCESEAFCSLKIKIDCESERLKPT